MCNVVFASPKSTFCSSRSYIPHCRDIPQIYLECSRNVVNFTAITVQIQNVLAQYIRTVQLTLLVHVQMYLPSVRDTILRPFADHFNPKVPFETLHDVTEMYLSERWCDKHVHSKACRGIFPLHSNGISGIFCLLAKMPEHYILGCPPSL